MESLDGTGERSPVSYTHLDVYKRQKEALTEIAQAHEFEIISLGGGRERMELPEYRAAAQRLEACLLYTSRCV